MPRNVNNHKRSRLTTSTLSLPSRNPIKILVPANTSRAKCFSAWVIRVRGDLILNTLLFPHYLKQFSVALAQLKGRCLELKYTECGFARFKGRCQANQYTSFSHGSNIKERHPHNVRSSVTFLSSEGWTHAWSATHSPCLMSSSLLVCGVQLHVKITVSASLYK